MFQRCSKNNFTYKNKMGLINRVLKLGKSLFYIYYIIFISSSSMLKKQACSNVPSFFKWIYICISFFYYIAKTELCLTKISEIYILAKNLEHWNILYNQRLSLEQTWNNFTYFWNKLGTKLGTYHRSIISYTIELGTPTARHNFT